MPYKDNFSFGIILDRLKAKPRGYNLLYLVHPLLFFFLFDTLCFRRFKNVNPPPKKSALKSLVLKLYETLEFIVFTC